MRRVFTALAVLLFTACLQTVTPPDDDPSQPVRVRLVFPSRSFEATAAAPGGEIVQREGRTSEVFELVFLDAEGEEVQPGQAERVELRVSGGGGLIVTAEGGGYSVEGTETGAGAIEILFIREGIDDQVVFTSAAIPVDVRPLPETAVLEAGGETVRSTAEGVDGSLNVEVGAPEALEVTLLRPDGSELALLAGETISVELTEGAAGVTLADGAGGRMLGATFAGQDALRVRLLNGSEELLAFEDVPVTAVLPPCDGPTSGGLCLREIARGLAFPVALVQPPGDNRLMVVRQRGTIISVDRDGTTDTFLDIIPLVKFGNEQGLLGLAFHPDYEANRTFFVYYKALDGDMVLARGKADPDGLRADPASVETVLVVPHDSETGGHNSGHIFFGPDGHLWITAGDGQTAQDLQVGQDLTDLRGSLLRIDVAPAPAPAGYTIPAGNPFADGAGGARPEIVHYGLRNPWQIHIDPVDRLLYVADVGETRFEEVNVVPLDELGSNFGWNYMEGTYCRIADCSAFAPTTVLPTYEYPTHGEGDAVIGGRVYRGADVPALQDLYVFADLRGFIRSVDLSGGAPVGLEEHFANGELFEDEDDPGLITAFGEDARGELYVLMFGGRIYRIEPEP